MVTLHQVMQIMWMMLIIRVMALIISYLKSLSILSADLSFSKSTLVINVEVGGESFSGKGGDL